jgi:CheY-like chemotaxis protein/PAS domain-containing protein
LSWLDRRGTEKETPASAANALRDLVARYPAAVVITDASGDVLETSAAARRLFGAPPSASSPERPVDPSMVASEPERFRARVGAIAAAGRPIVSEEVPLSDGRIFERDYASLEAPGFGTVHFWEYRDVTERVGRERARHEAAARLQFLINLGRTVLYSCRVAADHDRTFVSENVREMLGHDGSRWTEPGFWRRALHPDDDARVLAEIPLLRERGVHTLEYRLRHEDGRVLHVRDEMRLICDSDDRPSEIVGWMTDVTAQPRIDTDLGKPARAVSAVVHDFSNLLLVIAGHAHLLKAGIPPDSADRWHVTEIAAAAERAAALTDQMRRLGSRPIDLPSPVRPSRRGEGEMVLVVDNEDAVRIFTGRALTGSGYKVIEARQAEEALEIAARHGSAIRAVITDVCMPGMGGCELVERLTTALPAIKVLLMSGYDADFLAQRQAVPSLTAAHFLQKPFTPDVLATRLREVLDN